MSAIYENISLLHFFHCGSNHFAGFWNIKPMGIRLRNIIDMGLKKWVYMTMKYDGSALAFVYLIGKNVIFGVSLNKSWVYPWKCSLNVKKPVQILWVFPICRQTHVMEIQTPKYT